MNQKQIIDHIKLEYPNLNSTKWVKETQPCPLCGRLSLFRLVFRGEARRAVKCTKCGYTAENDPRTVSSLESCPVCEETICVCLKPGQDREEMEGDLL